MAEVNDFSKQLVTPESLVTFGGLTTLTVAVTNGIAYAFDIEKPRWLGLVVAIVLCLVAACIGKDTTFHSPTGPEAAFAILNSFVVYSAAVGGNTLAAGRSAPADQGNGVIGAARKGFFRPWV